MMRKGFKIFLYIIGALIMVLLLVPVLFKDKVSGLVRTEINQRIHGRFDFSKAGLSLIRSFPDLSLSVHDLAVSGADTFAQTRFFEAKAVHVSIDFFKLLRHGLNGIQLKKIHLEDPVLNLVSTPSGTFNYNDLFQSTSDDSTRSESELEIQLKSIKIDQGAFNYSDSSSQLFVSFNHLNHQSSGNYSGAGGSMLSLDHKNDFDSLTLRFGEIEYLSHLKGLWNGKLSANLDSSTYTLSEDRFKLNELQFDLKMFLHVLEDKTRMDIQIKTPQNDIRQLVSVIPGAYQKHFDKITTSGEFSLEGSLKGNYSSSGSRPEMDIMAAINQGMVKYGHLPYPVENINLDLRAQSMDTLFNSILIQLPKFSFSIRGNPLEGHLTVDHQKSGNQVQGLCRGNMELGDFQQALPLDSMTLAGNLNLDIQFDFNDQALRNKDFEKLKLTGSADAQKLDIRYYSYPRFKTNKLIATLHQKNVQVRFMEVGFGQSDLDGNATIVHPLAWFSKHRSLTEVQIQSSSNLLNFNELITTESSITCDTCFSTRSYKPLQIPSLNLNSKAFKVIYRDYDIRDIDFHGVYRKDTLFIQSLTGNINQSRLTVSGRLDKPYAWSSDQAVLTGHLGLKSDLFLVDPWMAASDSDGGMQDSSYSKKLIPRTALSITPEIKQLKYGKYLVRDIRGRLDLIQQTLEIHEGSGLLFNGKVNLDGTFSETGNLPLFNFKLDLSKLGFSDMFRVSTTFAKLAPIAEFLEGVFSASLALSGRLDQNQLPIWKELNAAGLVETATALLAKYKPLEDLAKAIQIPLLDLIKWEKSRNWFEVINGILYLKPFDIRYQGIPISIKGSHSLDQEINYNLLFRIPRPLFDKYKVGLVTNQKLDWLLSEVKKKGFDVGRLDTININLNLTGPLRNPASRLQWMADPQRTVEQQVVSAVEETVQEKVDSLETLAREKVEQVRDSIVESLRQETEKQKARLDSMARSAVDTLTGKVTEKAKEALDSTLKKESEKILDSLLRQQTDSVLGKKAKEEIDKINEKLKNWDPFKKKQTKEKND